jgi:phosphocarrier protein
MFEKTVTISNRAGIHARPAAVLVQAAKDFPCTIYFVKDSDRINAKSIMGILTLGASYGTEIKIIAEGEQEELAVETLAGVFNSKFEED